MTMTMMMLLLMMMLMMMVMMMVMMARKESSLPRVVFARLVSPGRCHPRSISLGVDFARSRCRP
eukprot:3622452-Karenia_brevis.AAC.1